jgi:hypothetical protein
MSRKLHGVPSDVNADNGEVQVDGPDGVSYSFTPEAADETSDRLLKGACAARGQQIEQEERDSAKRG